MMTKGAVALRRMVRERGTTKVSIARELGVGHPALISWLKGHKRPSWPNRFRIRDWSGGAITAESWDEPSEAAQ